MSDRTVQALILLGSISITALGCTSQATAPSPAAAAQSGPSAPRFGDRVPGVVYVTSQGLYYDTFAVVDPLPMKGKFQLLTEDGQTEFGPGQPGYLGGRWWVDLNGNDVQDSTDHYFLCPLLPPGRSTP